MSQICIPSCVSWHGDVGGSVSGEGATTDLPGGGLDATWAMSEAIRPATRSRAAKVNSLASHALPLFIFSIGFGIGLVL
ncbi:MAG: hypothetical protein GKR90_27795 [Pseudomonadales bacterium]|nr:hypothetical protein [Pseudomonadales bacterium]